MPDFSLGERNILTRYGQWKLEHKGEDTYSMVLEDGFAAKIGDDNLLYTTTDPGLSHEWELRPVLVKGPEVY